jgi:hypothetical protein
MYELNTVIKWREVCKFFAINLKSDNEIGNFELRDTTIDNKGNTWYN